MPRVSGSVQNVRKPGLRPKTSEPSPPPEPVASRTFQALVRSLLTWFGENARDLPWRRTLDPYAVWISEIMLQQTQVKTVIPYWDRWMRELPDVRALAHAKPERVLKLWEGLGYYTRARNLQKAAQQVVRDSDGAFPNTFDGVLALPGIGRYTAGAITSIAYNQPSPILDGNVIRVLSRLFGIAEDPREKSTNARLWDLALRLVRSADGLTNPKLETQNSQLRFSGPCSALNQSLMELGALVCTPRQPRCQQCPLRRRCVAHATDRVEALPNLGPRLTATARRFMAFAVEHKGCWLVRRRPAGVVNADLWEFPNLEMTDSDHSVDSAAASALGTETGHLRPLATIKHTITRYRISLEVYLTTVSGRPHPNGDDRERWLALADLNQLPFTSAHRKVLTTLQRRGCITR